MCEVLLKHMLARLGKHGNRALHGHVEVYSRSLYDERRWRLGAEPSVVDILRKVLNISTIETTPVSQQSEHDKWLLHKLSAHKPTPIFWKPDPSSLDRWSGCQIDPPSSSNILYVGIDIDITDGLCSGSFDGNAHSNCHPLEQVLQFPCKDPHGCPDLLGQDSSYVAQKFSDSILPGVKTVFELVLQSQLAHKLDSSTASDDQTLVEGTIQNRFKRKRAMNRAKLQTRENAHAQVDAALLHIEQLSYEMLQVLG